ncbi:MAG: hypothetical protein CMJ86_08125 [Planctomycetes bacterium]|nr:hypothetical protein [Planctomycetota bacterium]
MESIGARWWGPAGPSSFQGASAVLARQNPPIQGVCVSFLALEPLRKAPGRGSSSFSQKLSSGQALLWLLFVSSSSYGWMTKPSIEGET